MLPFRSPLLTLAVSFSAKNLSVGAGLPASMTPNRSRQKPAPSPPDRWCGAGLLRHGEGKIWVNLHLSRDTAVPCPYCIDMVCKTRHYRQRRDR
ncbi:MAG: hypothetical protein RLZZ338_1859 [Cyanobacteriota bacterium]|jgi:hypothetical protein